MSFLYYLYRVKGVMPWEVYEQSRGYQDLILAFAALETEPRADG